MKRYQFILPLLAGATLFLNACKKEGASIFNMFEGVKVTLNKTGATDVGEYQLVNDGDAVTFNATLESDQDMYGISILEVGTATPITKVVLDNSQRRSATIVYPFKANVRTGSTAYRIYATDKLGVYMGDGHKVITIDVKNNFDLNPEQHVDLADSAVVDAGATLATPPTITYTARPAAKSFYSLDNVKAYNYADAQANSAKVDFGIYAKTTASKNATTGIVTVTYNFYAYSPTFVASTFLPFSGFDFSSWTKRDTRMVNTSQNSATFVGLKTGTQVITAAVAAKPTATSAEIKGGNTFYILTPDGRYAAVYVDKIGYDRIYGYYANFFVKYAYKQ